MQYQENIQDTGADKSDYIWGHTLCQRLMYGAWFVDSTDVKDSTRRFIVRVTYRVDPS